MLFDPLEEQFDLPAALVKLQDGERGQKKLLVRKMRILSVAASW